VIVSIHQPEHLPYLGYFNKMARCDKYIILDDVQFTKNNFQNRNKIIDKNNHETWLSVPVEMKNHTQLLIKDMKIANIANWQKKYIKTIEQIYSKHEYYHKYIEEIKSIIIKHNKYLIDLNMAFIYFFRNTFNIDSKIIFSSSLNVNSVKNERVIDLCKSVGATTYLSGNGAKNYLDSNSFSENGLELIYQDYEHPSYNSKNFMPYLSSLDLLMNCGEDGENIVKKN